MNPMHPDFIVNGKVKERGGAIFSRNPFPGVRIFPGIFSRGAKKGSSFFMSFCVKLFRVDPIFDKEKSLCPTRT